MRIIGIQIVERTSRKMYVYKCLHLVYELSLSENNLLSTNIPSILTAIFFVSDVVINYFRMLQYRARYNTQAFFFSKLFICWKLCHQIEIQMSFKLLVWD